MAGLMEILRILSSNKILRDKAFNIAKNTKFDKKPTWLIDLLPVVLLNVKPRIS